MIIFRFFYSVFGRHSLVKTPTRLPLSASLSGSGGASCHRNGSEPKNLMCGSTHGVAQGAQPGRAQSKMPLFWQTGRTYKYIRATSRAVIFSSTAASQLPEPDSYSSLQTNQRMHY